MICVLYPMTKMGLGPSGGCCLQRYDPKGDTTKLWIVSWSYLPLIRQQPVFLTCFKAHMAYPVSCQLCWILKKEFLLSVSLFFKYSLLCFGEQAKRVEVCQIMLDSQERDCVWPCLHSSTLWLLGRLGYLCQTCRHPRGHQGKKKLMRKATPKCSTRAVMMRR